MNNFLNSVLTIAFRDLAKFLRDRTRLIATFIFPIMFIGVLGGSLQSNLSDEAGYNFMAYVFTGVLGQVLFQSTASGIISLIEDRTNDFSQEMFISPVSRYTIIVGKIIGESSVSLIQGLGVLGFAILVGVNITLLDVITMAPGVFAASLFGGAFGLLVLANLNSERSANQIFPFVIFPQFFLSGVFSPIKQLPLVLDILSRLSPMRYAVDLIRGLYYLNKPEYSLVVLADPLYNIFIIIVIFIIFTVIGTRLFVSREKNR